ncbi:hypothetical protein [Streptomyces sp. NPDC003077]|uniref:hypothetical protein n=1 Tax=Streptomyces sp. NPDC003077 TaxID=3154443 RepID=UPI0033B6ADD2
MTTGVHPLSLVAEQVPVPSIDITEQIERLQRLGEDFASLHQKVRTLSFTPGTDALNKISPLLLTAQDLTGQALRRLATLNGSPYTDLPGSRPALTALASVVSSSSLAGSDLSGALGANPYEGTAFPGPPADEDSVRKTRHAQARPVMTEHLADTAHQLDLCATGCRYLAAGIRRDLRHAAEQRPPHTPAPKLSATQHAALRALAQGEGKLYESHRIGTLRVQTKDGTRVSMATFRALKNRDLIRADARTSLLHGRDITVTSQGQRALAHAHQSPGPAPFPSSPAPAALPAARHSEVRR